MDKKTILGIVVVAALFLGFAYFNTKQQEKYQQEMAAYQAYQDSVAAATRPVVPVADSTAVAASDTAAPEAAANAADAVRRQQVAALGEYLAGARDAEAEEFTVENDVMIVTFSTRGGRITGVTLKDYTKYAPRGKRDQLIELMDPARARFDLSFYVKNGLNNVKVNTDGTAHHSDWYVRQIDSKLVLIHFDYYDELKNQVQQVYDSIRQPQA